MDRYMASETELMGEEVQIDDQRNRFGKWEMGIERNVPYGHRLTSFPVRDLCGNQFRVCLCVCVPGIIEK